MNRDTVLIDNKFKTHNNNLLYILYNTRHAKFVIQLMFLRHYNEDLIIMKCSLFFWVITS